MFKIIEEINYILFYSIQHSPYFGKFSVKLFRSKSNEAKGWKELRQKTPKKLHRKWKCHWLKKYSHVSCFISPPASKVSWEKANLTWRKKPNTPAYGVKEFVCLSVCLSVCSDIWWTNSYLDSHQLQGSMKFATQISPLLNLFTVFK